MTNTLKRYFMIGSAILLAAVLLQIGLNWDQVSTIIMNTISRLFSSLFELCFPIVGIWIMIKSFFK